MKSYSALVKDGNRLVEIKNEEYPTKSAFIHDLRANGYIPVARFFNNGKFLFYVTL